MTVGVGSDPQLDLAHHSAASFVNSCPTIGSCCSLSEITRSRSLPTPQSGGREHEKFAADIEMEPSHIINSPPAPSQSFARGTYGMIWHGMVSLAMLCKGHVWYSERFRQSIDQPGMFANPAHGELSRKNGIFPVPYAFKMLISRRDEPSQSRVIPAKKIF